MSDIASIGHGPAGRVQQAAIGHGPGDSGTGPIRGDHERPADRVELSPHARFLDRIRQLPEVRVDRIQQVREAIAQGRYLTEDKIEVAVDRLLEDLREQF